MKNIIIKVDEKDNKIVEKPWGSFLILYQELKITIKILTVKAGRRLSLQSHQNRHEFWLVIEGNPSIQYGSKDTKMEPSRVYSIPKTVSHRLIANDTDCRVLETSFGIFDEEDIIRYKDDYDRL